MVQRTKNQNTLDIGSWNASCDRCGFKFKNTDLRKTWDGLYVCKDDWEARHPSDFQGQVDYRDDPSTPWSRPESTDSSGTDIDGNDTGFNGSPVNVGDTDKTLTIDDDPSIQIWNTALTASRTATLDTVGALSGDVFQIYRTAESANSLFIGGTDGVPVAVSGEIGSWLASTTAETITSSGNIITNGFFSSDTVWSKGTGWTISGSNASKAAGVASVLGQPLTLVEGNSYTIQFTVSGRTAGSVQMRFDSAGTAPFVSSTAASTNDTFAFTLVAVAGNDGIEFSADASFDGNIDSVTCYRADPDLSTNDLGLEFRSTIIKSPAASGSSILGYSGFTSSAYLVRPYSSTFDLTTNFSIAAWMKTSASDFQAIAGNYEDGGDDGGSMLYMDNTGLLYMKARSNAGADIDAVSVDTYNDDAWHYVVGSVDSAGLISLYVDGALVDTTAGASIGATTTSFHVGVYGGTWSNFEGSIALVRMYNTVLSATSITTIYERERVHFLDGGSELIKEIPANTPAILTARYNGTSWVLESYTTIGL